MGCNSHHLMLLYHVARHGGICRALPHMPYGIQQPALSGQLITLEREVGVTLFSRRPFALTPAGARLFQHARAFFEPLDALVETLRQPEVPVLRIGASELILREYMPAVVAIMRAREPRVRFEFCSGPLAQMTAAIHDGKVDLAIAAVDRPPRGLATLPITRLALVLLAPRPLGTIPVPALAAPGRVSTPLIGPGPQEGITQAFRRGLARRGVDWPTGIEASSIALVPWFVARGSGLGLCLDFPVLVKHPQVRPVPLTGFEPVDVVALWRRPARALLATFVQVIEAYAAQLADLARAGGGRGAERGEQRAESGGLAAKKRKRRKNRRTESEGVTEATERGHRGGRRRISPNPRGRRPVPHG